MMIRSIPSNRLNVIISKIKEKDENTVEIEFVPEEKDIKVEEKKFKDTDYISFLKIKPIEQQSDEELSKVDTCPYCDRLVEPDSYIAINDKRICKSCIEDLKNQLKEDIINRRKK